METIKKKYSFKERLEIVGWEIWRYKKIYIVVLFLVSIFELAMIINSIIYGKFNTTRNIVYFSAYVFLFVMSLGIGISFLLLRKKEKTPLILSILFHVYCVCIVAWAATISCLDMTTGDYPIVYLTILATIGGLVALNPIVLMALVAVSLPVIFIFAYRYKDIISFGSVGGIFNIIVFVLMAFVVGFRMYYVTFSENRYKDYIRRMNNTDVLTGLGNERKYFKIIDEIDKEYPNYAIAVMDMNGLKATNDLYGHRYGCRLVVECGHRLPSIFPNSFVFHIGGDEFVAIIVGKDYENLEYIQDTFYNSLSYTSFSFDGQDLALSVSIGFAVKADGEDYNQVFQRADDLMYENKRKVKALHNMTTR